MFRCNSSLYLMAMTLLSYMLNIQRCTSSLIIYHTDYVDKLQL